MCIQIYSVSLMNHFIPFLIYSNFNFTYENKSIKNNLLANRQFAIIKSAILFFEQGLKYARKMFLKAALGISTMTRPITAEKHSE